MKAQVGIQYRHYKNKQQYTVIAIGYYTEAEPLRECVVYQAHYDTDDLGAKPIFIRPRDMFEEQLEYAGQTVDRFQIVP